jgi:hypothetical protein
LILKSFPFFETFLTGKFRNKSVPSCSASKRSKFETAHESPIDSPLIFKAPTAFLVKFGSNSYSFYYEIISVFTPFY